MDRTNQSQPRRRLGTPSNVHPDRLSGPAHGVFVWATVLLVWLVSLLPWRLWQGAPDVLLLIIAFWCVHEPRRVGLFTAFFFGLLMDVHDAGLLGEHALSYTLVAYGAVVLHRRLQRFDLWSQAMHMLPVFFIARFVTQIIHAWLAGKWPGWDWGISVLLTAALWPLAGWVLHLPQRGADDAESSSA
ncbi:Rod shape-determining protein MreD [compost metagenome]